MRKSLQHRLHELIPDGNELFDLRVCIVGIAGIVGLVVAVAGLVIAVVVPCVHHVRGFRREVSYPVLIPNRVLIVCVSRNQVYTHTI
jgi:hypothetical protein